MITPDLRRRWSGIHVTMVTPFTSTYALDEIRLRKVVDNLIADGVDAINHPLTTGEGSALTLEEHKTVVSIVADQVAGRVPYLAGVARTSTRESVELARHATAAGADGIIGLSPYYLQLNQAEMYRHFHDLASSVDTPLVIYNHPPITKSSMSADTALRLSALPNVVGFFPTNLDLGQLLDYSLTLRGELLLLAGREEILPVAGSLGFEAQSTSCFHFVPNLVSSIWSASQKGEVGTALELFSALEAWRKLVRRKTEAGHFGAFAAYTKASMRYCGVDAGFLRPPLTEISPDEMSELERVLDANLGCIRR